MAKVFSITNGCEEGQLKSMHVQEFFMQNGFSITSELTDADFILFFSCGLTAPKERQSINIIRRIQAQKKSEAKFIVWGCLSKINPQELQKIYSGPIVGPKDLDFFDHLLQEKAISINDVSANALILPSDLELQTISHRVSLN
jgi:tRNA A37 methylthiotransferase MiaB